MFTLLNLLIALIKMLECLNAFVKEA